MFSKPRLSMENSIIVAMGVAALVIGIYNYSVGPIADAHASPANDGNMQASVKKAGVKSVILVTAVALLAQDANIVMLGASAIMGEELTYRHAIMANPDNGKIEVTAADYMPAGGQAAEPVGSTALGTYSAPGPVEAMAG